MKNLYKQTIQGSYLEKNPRKRGAIVAAASKRWKKEIVLQNLERITKTEDLDMTPTLAKQLIKCWLGRSVSDTDLRRFFGTKGRTASQISKDFEIANDIAQRHTHRISKQIAAAERKMSDIRIKCKLRHERRKQNN